MLDQFSLTAMAVNYTRAQTQHDPLASQRFVINQTIKTTGSACHTHRMLAPSLLGDRIPSQDIIRCNFLQKKNKNLNVIIEKQVQMQGQICISLDSITL